MNDNAIIIMTDDSVLEFVVAMLDSGAGVDDIPVVLFELEKLSGVAP